MFNDIRVLPSLAVEVVGDGEPSDSGWEFGSECGSVAVSGVLVVADVGEMEQYVNNSECIKLGIAEVEDCSLGPEFSDVVVKRILRNATRNGRTIFEVFSVKASGDGMIVKDEGNSKRRKLGRKAKDPRRKTSESGKCWNLEGGEDLKVGLCELKEQLESPEEAGIFLSYRLPNKQGMREAKSSSRFSGEKRLRCASPVWRGGTHNLKDWWS